MRDNKRGLEKSLKVNKRGVAISGGEWELEKLHIFSCVLWQFDSFASYVTERTIWKLALNHANIFSKQQTMSKMSNHELLSPDNSGSGWDNVLVGQKINKRRVTIRLSWYVFFEKINSWGGGRLI